MLRIQEDHGEDLVRPIPQEKPQVVAHSLRACQCIRRGKDFASQKLERLLNGGVSHARCLKES